MQLSKMYCVCTHTHKVALSCAQPSQLISPGYVVLDGKSPWPLSPRPRDNLTGQPIFWLAVDLFMRTGKYKRNVLGWRTHRRTYAVAHSFLQQACPPQEWFIFSRKDADQGHLALFEDPA